MKTIMFRNFDHGWFRAMCWENCNRIETKPDGFTVQLHVNVKSGAMWIEFNMLELTITVSDKYYIQNVDKNWLNELVHDLQQEVAENIDRQYMDELKTMWE